ncbi:MAG: 3'-5' exonuclease [Candidatus Eisenbacteria sp.]|nr:3'-5' exonuclease [Candidatus Eisenbacteria bacterium]
MYSERVVVFDVETTGFKHDNDRVIELGVIWIESGRKVMDLAMLLDPEVCVSEKITEITGIKQAMLLGKPLFGDVCDFVIDLLASPSVLVAYNGEFDIRFLTAEVGRCGKNLAVSDKVIDPLKWVRSTDTGSCKLGAAAERRGIDVKNAHRALGDCYTTLKLLCKIDMPDGLNDTLEVQAGLRRKRRR